MKRFSRGILAGLTALAIAPQAMAATGWCQNTGNGGAPFQDSFSFIESFTNPSQNQAGMEFPRLYHWSTGGTYKAKCDCDSASGVISTYHCAKNSRPPTPCTRRAALP